MAGLSLCFKFLSLMFSFKSGKVAGFTLLWINQETTPKSNKVCSWIVVVFINTQLLLGFLKKKFFEPDCVLSPVFMAALEIRNNLGNQLLFM